MNASRYLLLMISLAGSLSPYSHFLHESKERLFASGQKGVKVGGLRVPTQEVSGAVGSARNDTITVCAQGRQLCVQEIDANGNPINNYVAAHVIEDVPWVNAIG